MIESLGLIDLYENKYRTIIKEERDIKINKIREKNETLKKVDDLMECFRNELNNLYLSQLDEEDLERLKNGEFIDRSKYPFVRDHKIQLMYSGCFKNYEFMNKEIKEIIDNYNNEMNRLSDFIKIVKAHVSIAKTKEEVEDILIKYEILNKKGKMVIA